MSWVPFACTVLTPASGLNLVLFSVEQECFNRSSFHSSASVNVLVQNCKIYNDASCDISADGQLLAAFIPSSQRGFPDEGILAVYSLAPHNLGEMLYTKRFGKHAARRQGRWVGLWEVTSKSAFNEKCHSLNVTTCLLESQNIWYWPTPSHKYINAGEKVAILCGHMKCW